MRALKRALLLPFFLSPLSASAAGVLEEMKSNAAIDLVAPVSFEDHSKNKMLARSVELQFFGPLDPNFDANLNVAGHYDEGQFKFELHEATVGSATLLPQSRFRVGKFFLGFGRLNTYHQHDWPFIQAPKAHRVFLTPGAENTLQSEGASDAGVEYSWLLPTAHFVELTVGATNGFCYGHCHTEGTKPPRPLFYVHPKTFFETESGGVALGVSYMNRKSAAKTKTDLYGLDLTWKARENKRLAWLLQTEFYYEEQKEELGELTRKGGFYAFPQYGFTEQLYLGLRLDGFSHLNMRWVTTNEHRPDFDYGVTPTLTWKPSEFSSLRLAYSHEVDTTRGEADVRDRQVQLQFTGVLGAHPAHEF